MIDVVKFDKKGNPKPLPTAQYIFDENVRVQGYSMTIARNLIASALQKEYYSPRRTSEETEEPKNAFDQELRFQEAKSKVSNRKITIFADPTEANSGFHQVPVSQDNSVQNYENQDMKLALEFIDKAISKNEGYGNQRLKALILAKMGDKKGAIEWAQKSIERAKKFNNNDYVRMNEKSIAEWKK